MSRCNQTNNSKANNRYKCYDKGTMLGEAEKYFKLENIYNLNPRRVNFKITRYNCNLQCKQPYSNILSNISSSDF